jgi:hypothetical protein
VGKGVGDSEQKAAETPMDKGIEKKIAIVNNFFENASKRGFLWVKLNQNGRFRRRKTAAGMPKIEEKTPKLRKRLGAGGGEIGS